MNLTKTIYELSPIWLQNIACTMKGFKEKKSRLGGDFQKFYDELKQSEWQTKAEIEAYQFQKLKELVLYCYNNIPYYKKAFDSVNFLPDDLKSLKDLERLPILDKELVRQNYNELKSTGFDGEVVMAHTSGSTGKSLTFLISQEAIRYRWALWFRHKARFGVKVDDPYATFTGQVVVPINQNREPYWRYNSAMKQTIFTMHHINPAKVPAIVNKLNQGGYTYYSGYPSILYSLATFIEELGLKITNSPKVIFTGAEALLSSQREKISKVFGCLVTDQYGFSEGCGNASRCEHDLFHEDFEYGILECHNPVYNEDGSVTGEVLATGFTNLSMPLIRYKVGDTATWVETECKCGRKTKTIREVNGRNEDYIVTPEGNKILRFDYIFKDATNVLEAQVIQRKIGEVIIRIVKRTEFSKKDEELIKKEVHSKVSPNFIVSFEYPATIERELTGKFRAVKSFLKHT